MRKWYVPLTVLGLSGLGVFFASDSGRKIVRRVVEGIGDAPNNFNQWNEAAQRELDLIQSRLNQLADSLGLGPANA